MSIAQYSSPVSTSPKCLKEISDIIPITRDIPESNQMVINRQHALLKSMLNDIIGHYNENYHRFDEEFAKSSIAGFVAYCFSHFLTEEAIHKRMCWSERDNHKEAHVKCREKMMEYQQGLTEEFSDEHMREAVEYIRDWFVEHTCGADTMFYAYLESEAE